MENQLCILVPDYYGELILQFILVSSLLEINGAIKLVPIKVLHMLHPRVALNLRKLSLRCNKRRNAPSDFKTSSPPPS